jgi:PAS domain S-box-containing protein
MASTADGSSPTTPGLDVRLVIDAILALAWSSHPDGAVEFVNQRWHDYTGLSPEESCGWGWKAAVHSEDLPELLANWQGSPDLEPRESKVRLRRSDGVFRWFLFRREPMHDEAGAVVRWYGTGIDIDDRKQTESLRAAEKRTLEMIADGASLRDVLDHLCSSIDVQVSASVTTILLMDTDGKRLWHAGGRLVPREWLPVISPLPVALEAGLCGTAAFLKKRVVVTDVATDPGWPDPYRDLAIRNGIRAGWSEPIFTKDNEVIGTFALYCSESRVPTEDDLALIADSAKIALIAIERQRSQEALRCALDDIRKSETKLRQVIDTIPTLAWCNLPAGPERVPEQTMA